MTNEEAAKVLEIHSEVMECGGAMTDPVTEALRIGCEAVKYRIPMKAIYTGVGPFDVAKCRNCGHILGALARDLSYKKYCSECGQALDWRI
jgi:hypothetical protein